MVGELQRGRLKTPDAHAEVFKQLTDNLKTSQVTEVDFSSCGIGPVALGHLSEWVRDAEAVVTCINCLANQFGDDDLATLLTAIEGTSVRSLCGLTEGQTTADFSGQNLGPMDMKIMAAEYEFQGFIAAVTNLVLDVSSIGGLDRWGKGQETQELLTVVDALANSNLTTLSLNTCGIGPAACAEALPRLLDSAHLTDLSLSDNCLTGATRHDHSKPWDRDIDKDTEGWLKTCEKLKSSKLVTLRLDRTGLGPVALRTLATSLPAAVADLNISEAIIGDAGATLVEAISSSSTLNFVTIGKGLRLPLKDNYDSDVLDASKKGIEPGGVTVIAWWLTTSAAAVVARLILDENPLTGGRRDVDKDITGVSDLFDTLKTSSVTELGLAKCRLGPGSLGKLVEYVRDAEAVVTWVSVLSNPIGDGVDALIEVFEQNDKIQTLLGLEEGVQVLDLSKKQIDPGQAKILAAEIRVRRFTAALTSINCSGNDAITGKRSRDNDGHASWIYGEQLEGWTTLCSSLRGSSITSLNFCSCQNSEWVRAATWCAVAACLAGRRFFRFFALFEFGRFFAKTAV